MMDKVEKLSVGVAKMELEHHARGEVIKNLREEREDHRASALRIRTLLAPLLGVPVDNEPADEMVGRFVALYEARDERVAEQRGHDKAMEWAATLAFDFDPFSEDWTDEQRGAGERVMGLFAERLMDEVARPRTKQTKIGFVGARPGEGNATSWSVADRTPRYASDDWASIEQVRFYLPRSGYVRLKAGAAVDGGQMGVSVDGGQEPGFVSSIARAGLYSVDREVELSEGWHTFALMGRQGARVTDRTLSVAVVKESIDKESLRTWNPPLVPAPSLDGGLTNEEVAAVRALLKREGK